VTELRFDGRVAVVTGAGAGLGRAHARLLAARGAAVVVNDLTAEQAVVVAEEIEANGGAATALAADVATEVGADALVAAARDRYDRLDIVVNNAGTVRAADFGAMTADAFAFMLAVNLTSAFLVTRAAWPLLTWQGYGRVVSTTSNSGLLGAAGSSGYAAAKAGVWGLTRSLALEGREHGIHVNAIAPLAFTDLSRTSRVAPESWRKGEPDAWGRRLDVELVSPVVAWLAHEDCTQTGEVWSVAGGRVARFVLGLNDGFVDDALTVESVRDHEADLLAPVEGLDVHDSGGAEGKALHRRLMRPRDRT
jgi:NAD(P)-dependent dehydrogenase (short-subunit alcohol dehydrogenase family)